MNEIARNKIHAGSKRWQRCDAVEEEKASADHLRQAPQRHRRQQSCQQALCGLGSPQTMPHPARECTTESGLCLACCIVWLQASAPRAVLVPILRMRIVFLMLPKIRQTSWSIARCGLHGTFREKRVCDVVFSTVLFQTSIVLFHVILS